MVDQYWQILSHASIDQVDHELQNVFGVKIELISQLTRPKLTNREIKHIMSQLWHEIKQSILA